MGYVAGGTNYNLGLRQSAIDKTTEAELGQLKRERADRVKKSGERSGLQKLLSAGVRGAAAFYTGGASEAMGFGGAIDEAMLGTDSEGRAVRNEYGELVGAASQIGTAMSAKKAGEAAKKLQMQQTADQAMQDRLDKLDPRLGMDYALKLQEKDKRNLDALQKHKSGFTGLLNEDVEGLDLEATTVGDWESSVKGAPKTPTPEASTIDYQKTLDRRGSGETFMPDAPTSSEEKAASAPVDIINDRRAQAKAREEELKNIGKAPQEGYSDREVGQRRARSSWFSNMSPKDRIKNKFATRPYDEKRGGIS